MTDTLVEPQEDLEVADAESNGDLGSDLARKYRPRKFKDVIGQNAVHGLAKRIATMGQSSISSAYLFTGIRGTGKTSTARIFARAVNCLNIQEGGEPCNECETCSLMLDSSWGDGIIELDAASNSGIDNIKVLIDRMSMSTRAKKRVIVLDEVHALSPRAEEALLKTLEEPSDNCIWVLCTTDPEKLGDTIISRCVEVKMKSLSEETLVSVLANICDSEGIEVDPELLSRAAYQGRGSARDSITRLQTLMLDSSDDSVTHYRMLDDSIATKSASSFLIALEEVYAATSDFEPFSYASHLIETMRSAMVLQIDESRIDSRHEFYSQIEGIADAFRTPRIIRGMQHISSQIMAISTSGRNNKALLEATILTLLVPTAGSNIESILDAVEDLQEDIQKLSKRFDNYEASAPLQAGNSWPEVAKPSEARVEEPEQAEEEEPEPETPEDEALEVEPESESDEEEDDQDEEVEGSSLSDSDLLDIYYDEALSLDGISVRSSKIADISDENIEIVRVGKIATKIIVKLETTLVKTPRNIITKFFEDEHSIEIEFIKE